ncbi:hypothetical protein L1987_28445 [Smallanthus sonchifolius]|uniref:Uncharacterized protein n=1 Tax=Smallanthus sonchifolius TaxID=185202 RepID=A0ACB9HX89_9ASTR|nr:hypothetical protein L1987_28445 [Smallanthus sonchifolius]
MQLTDWVLCKIYKKESTRAVNNDNDETDQQVQNTRNQGEVIPQQNELHDDQSPPAQRRRVLANSERNQLTDQQVQHHETNHNLGKNTNPTLITMQPFATFQDPNQVQSFSGSSTCEYYYMNQSKSTLTNDYRFSREIVEQQVHNTYHEDSETLVNMQSCYNGSYMDAADWEPDDCEALMSLLDEDDHTDFTFLMN